MSTDKKTFDFLTPNKPFVAGKETKKDDALRPMTLTKNKLPTTPQPTFKAGLKSTYKTPEQKENERKQKELELKQAEEKQAEMHKKEGAPKALEEHNRSSTESAIAKSTTTDLQAVEPAKMPSILSSKTNTSSSNISSKASSFTSSSSSSSVKKNQPSVSSILNARKPDSLMAHDSKPYTPNLDSRREHTTTNQSTSAFTSKSASNVLSSAAKTTAPVNSSARNSETTASHTASKASESMSQQDFLNLRDFLYEKSGIFVTETRKYLFENRLTSRLQALNLKDYAAYLNYLKTKDASKVELNKFYEKMTTNETSFFRNVPQLDTVRDEIFQKIIEKNKSSKKIRIWSAGCSSGEEPYTFAMMLSEMLKNELSSWNIKITANDLSPAMLKIAEEGAYGEYSLRTTPPEYIEKYFTKKDNLYYIKPALKKLIKFGQINLNDPSMTSKVEKSQVVFCRNVIIYFDEDVRDNVVSAFYNNLEDDGDLIIGHSETLQNIADKFNVAYRKGTSIYQKIPPKQIK